MDARPPKGKADVTMGSSSMIALPAAAIFFTITLYQAFSCQVSSFQKIHGLALLLKAESYKLTAMSWLRSHPYTASIIGAALLILLGGLIVGKRASVQPQDSSLRAWGGVGANLLNPASENAPGAPYQSGENLYTEVRGGPPFYYAPATAQIPRAEAGADDFDFDAFLGMLSSGGGSASGGGLAEGGASFDAYSFIPTGLLSTSTPPGRERTPVQQALYNYANEAASNIQTYEEIYRGAPQILKNQFEDRHDPAKNAALLGVANGLAGVGNALLSMEEIPSQAQTAHERLGKSYQGMGGKPSLIPDARGDQELIDAMLAYNATVETYVKNYVALATLLSTYGVAFSADDPGSVFTFTQGGF